MCSCVAYSLYTTLKIGIQKYLRFSFKKRRRRKFKKNLQPSSLRFFCRCSHLFFVQPSLSIFPRCGVSWPHREKFSSTFSFRRLALSSPSHTRYSLLPPSPSSHATLLRSHERLSALRALPSSLHSDRGALLVLPGARSLSPTSPALLPLLARQTAPSSMARSSHPSSFLPSSRRSSPWSPLQPSVLLAGAPCSSSFVAP
jgi:hypothetical protein